MTRPCQPESRIMRCQCRSSVAASVVAIIAFGIVFLLGLLPGPLEVDLNPMSVTLGALAGRITDIADQLGLHMPLELVTGFERPNLTLAVEHCRTQADGPFDGHRTAGVFDDQRPGFALNHRQDANR